MEKNQDRTEKLCPFKKKIVREDSRAERGEMVSREKFEHCAGERCMAYKMDTFSGVCCLRLMNDQS